MSSIRVYCTGSPLRPVRRARRGVARAVLRLERSLPELPLLQKQVTADLAELKAEYKIVTSDPRWPASDQNAINGVFNGRKDALEQEEAA